MNDESRSVQRAVRWAALISAVTVGALLVVLLVYIAYIYNLWTRAMQAEGAPGAPPP